MTGEVQTVWINGSGGTGRVERRRRELLGARLMTVHGGLEREGEVVHLIANRLVDDSRLLGELGTASRDFQ